MPTATPTATPAPGATLLSPTDHTLILIDYQSQMSFATKSIDVVNLRNNAALVAKAAKEFGVSTILTTVAEKTFSGPMFAEITSVFPEETPIDRTTMPNGSCRIAMASSGTSAGSVARFGSWQRAGRI